ncbi:MAG: transposase, partial [Candidatus Gracilibacteria bacterium]|nr:transposase [Candidatus Gracilibacteria bacterium]
KRADYSKITSGGIGGDFKKKRHNYLTTFVNFKTKKVSCIVEGKGADTVKEIVEDIENHGGKRDNITDISIDFGPAFISGVTKYMPRHQ